MWFTRVSRVLHVFNTCVTRGCPWAKFWAVQNFLPRPTPFRFFSASYHVYKSTVTRLKLDINTNNIVCFTGDNFLTGFGRDQAVKRCVTGPSYIDIYVWNNVYSMFRNGTIDHAEIWLRNNNNVTLACLPPKYQGILYRSLIHCTFHQLTHPYCTSPPFPTYLFASREREGQ